MTDQLRGMQLTVKRNKKEQIVSQLIGRINDQASLLGLFNTLYELHLPVVSVKILEEIDD